jgi:uncharacterized protein (DUF362 family)
MNMKRRDFIKKSIGAGVAVSAALTFGNSEKLLGSQLPGKINTDYDIVAIKGGEPDIMLRKAIEAMGGLGKYIKKGQKVLIKPNIGWDAIPERAANTNPVLISELVKQCFNAGAKEVNVFDNTCNEWTQCYKNSGIEKAVKDAGGKMVPGNSESYYQYVELPKGTKLKNAKVHELVLSSDVFINVPVLKHHDSAGLSIAMKNLMGIVWDRGFWHRNDLHRCIAEFPLSYKPHLNIVDAYNVMMKNGPRGISVSDVQKMQYLLVSTDIVAIDAAAAKIFGTQPEQIKYIRIAADELKSGRRDLENLKINRITL